jgi:hypothetical protein
MLVLQWRSSPFPVTLLCGLLNVTIPFFPAPPTLICGRKILTRCQQADFNKTQSNVSLKRTNDGDEEPDFKKLKFDKESILADLNFKKRTSFKNDGYVAAGQTPSEADTEIDTESVPRLLADNVAITYGFQNASNKKAADEGAEKKSLRDEIAAPGMMGGRSVERRKSMKLVIRFPRGNIENEANESTTHIRPVSRRWAVAVSGTNVNFLNPATNLDMSATKQQAEKKLATEETPKMGKTPPSYLESPVSPKTSPDVRSPAADSLLTLELS